MYAIGTMAVVGDDNFYSYFFYLMLLILMQLIPSLNPDKKTALKIKRYFLNAFIIHESIVEILFVLLIFHRTNINVCSRYTRSQFRDSRTPRRFFT